MISWALMANYSTLEQSKTLGKHRSAVSAPSPAPSRKHVQSGFDLCLCTAEVCRDHFPQDDLSGLIRRAPRVRRIGESEAFHETLAEGRAPAPLIIAEKLVAEFKL
jgi:hypothetical protein